MMIDIATGQSRGQKNWKNQQVTWETFLKKISVTHRTAETYAQYIAFPKEKQAEIKDVGGFVGGYLLEGRRKPEKVKHRQLLCLDIDYGHSEFWEDYQMYYGNTALIYSTHKHSPEEPRFRLILPLSRPVGREEYEAISRKIAGTLGIQYFDSTTFQVERLMYWPSTASDGVYFFEHQEGPWLDPAKILALYNNWTDISEWPICNNEKDLIKSSLKKQGDPTEKPGLIGAFCRAFSITEAIDNYLPDEYTHASGDRYTYTEGSTAAGAIVYDDLFLYSHHSTDPTSMQLCNAFDLVRIHKYGHLDEGETITDPTRMKSFIAMIDYIRVEPEVLKEIDDFANIPEDEKDWVIELEFDKRGGIKPTINNLLVIINNDSNLKGAFAYNEFDCRDFIRKATPWDPSTELRCLSEKDDAGLRHYIEKTYHIHTPQKMKDAADLASAQNKYHPVRDYLASLQWDGQSRLDTLFIDALGAPDTEYVRAVTRKSIVAAIARILRPGIKYDYVLTFVGTQGMRKSSMLREMGKEWFSDSLDSVAGKDAYEQLQGAWIIEMAELSGLKKAEIESVKHFITKQEDRYRVAYGRRVESFPRQCVFFGTTNESTFLRDATGNRRFWPVPITKQYEAGTVNVDQIWAEAKMFYAKGEKIYLPAELETHAMLVQKEHAENDERIGLIDKYLNMKLPANWKDMSVFDRRQYLSSEDDLQPVGTVERTQVCVAEIWCEILRGELKDMNTNSTKFLHSIMQNMEGWKKLDTNRKFARYGYQRTYIRKGASMAEKMLVLKDEHLN